MVDNKYKDFDAAIAETPPLGKTLVTELGFVNISTMESVVD